MNANNKKSLEVLCVTMHQQDFSIINDLNVSSDIVIANQANFDSVIEKSYPWGHAKMISTQTRGVGLNRNTAFIHSRGDILLLSDDDMHYTNNYVEDIISEFEAIPDADVIIFNITSSDPKRAQKSNKITRKLGRFSRLPYGAPRIAIRRAAWEKSNVWFTTLFGGGAKYTNGEDSMFLIDLRKKGLNLYVSSKNIGTIQMDTSSWFHGADREFYFNKGALCFATSPYIRHLKLIYFLIRVKSELTVRERISAFFAGIDAYRNGFSYRESKEEDQ